MLEELKFNQDLYKFRMENQDQLLLYNVTNGQIFLVEGNTKDYLMNNINNERQNITIENKYLDFFIKNDILEEM